VLTGTVVVVTAVVEVAGVVEVATPAVVEEVADDVVIVVVTLVARGREPEQADTASITTDAAKAFGKRRLFMLLCLRCRSLRMSGSNTHPQSFII
jgi:hypothetical protein